MRFGIRPFLALLLSVGLPATGAAAQDPSAPPGMTDRETAAYALWSMRAGLNVAALQCQFSKTLRTVENYNAFLRQHSDELATAYKVLGDYFSRTAGKGRAGARSFDSFSTRVYQNFVAFDAQYAFCNAAAETGRRALMVPKGKATPFAIAEVPAFRASLAGKANDFDNLGMNLGWVRVPDVATACGRRRC